MELEFAEEEKIAMTAEMTDSVYEDAEDDADQDESSGIGVVDVSVVEKKLELNDKHGSEVSEDTEAKQESREDKKDSSIAVEDTLLILDEETKPESSDGVNGVVHDEEAGVKNQECGTAVKVEQSNELIGGLTEKIESLTFNGPEVQESEDEFAEPKTTESNHTVVSTSDSDVERTLANIKGMALRKDNQIPMIQDGCSLLMLSLIIADTENGDSSVFSPQNVLEALSILHILSQNAENRALIKTTTTICMRSLGELAKNKKMPEEIVCSAALIYDMLSMPIKNEKPRGRGKGEDSKKRKVNRSMTASKMVHLYISHNVLFKDRRQKITDALQVDKDVLSITYDLKKYQCLIRVREKATPESFGKTIANIGFECYLIAHNEKNEEIKVEIKADSKLGDNVYEYLSESDEDKDKSIEDNAVATAEDIKKAEKKGKGWFSSAANFVQNSFYW